jgi:hypothetical protein
MANLEKYPTYVETLIKKYSLYKPSYGEVEVQTILDRENHHYLLASVGWDYHERIRGCLLHIDIKDHKIWIQHDGTKDSIADELVAMGVPKEDIILAYHAPYKRKFTEFAGG